MKNHHKKAIKKIVRKNTIGLISNFFNLIKIKYASNDQLGSYSIRYLENGRITNNCVILKNWRVLKSTIIFQDRFDKFNRLKFILKYILPSFPFAERTATYFTIADEWCKNYCHWMFEALTRLIVLTENNPKAKLLLPESFIKINFITKSLEAFGIKKENITIIRKNSNFKFKKIIFIPCCNNQGEIFSAQGYFDFIRFKQIKETILNHFQKDLTTNLGERIYISRNFHKSNNIRKLNNEFEIIPILELYGFKTVYMENLAFCEQVSIARNSKIIVATHGAGIANAMFMKEGGKVFELFNKEWENNNCFEEMSKRLDLYHFRQECVPEKTGQHVASNITVDVEKFKENLIKFIS
jgi:capsular polysaccharide biosynthesis protein